jgi:alkanesulfonate monooxygenase SsuD/methylene tetrahydromethanopterin reductase-like flavin-dependent oxidoreductase (luciferase family)
MAATLDIVSNGRLELGIGAGWYEQESQQLGFDFPEPAVRIRRLQESVKIIKLMWKSEKASFDGKYYSIHDATGNPKPIQKPAPPIWIGIIKGTKLMPKIAAEVADGVNLTFMTPATCQQMIDLLDAECKKINRSRKEIQLSWQGRILIASDERDLAMKEQSLAAKAGVDVTSFRNDLKSRAAIVGTPEDCARQLETYVNLGIDQFILIFMGDKSLAPMKLFAEQVIPQLT